ncbi:hypothetical protein [Salipaludibacillus sp. CF4.18]|uniref:hypothetical protein n=1 Tax=Salipaludibacillus sp. CF4.18 TaxID=3373081 RepID=UPI003EE4DFE5
MELFKMFGRILIDDKEANASISRTDKKTKSMGDRLKGGIKTAAKFGAALAAGATVAVGAMIGLGIKVGNTADEILDLNSTTGMTTEAIQEWRKVTEEAGVATDAVANASLKLTKNLDTMSVEGHKGQEALGKLGLSLAEIENMSADERMDVLTKALSGVGDKTDRAKIGTDLFGGSWKELAPVVDLGAEAMDNAKGKANIISEEDLKKANDFRITVENMKEKVSFFVTEIAINLLPMLQGMFGWFEAQMPKIQYLTENAFGLMESAIRKISEFITVEALPVLMSLWEWIEPNIPKIKEFFVDAFGSAHEILNNLIDVLREHALPALIELWEWIEPNLPLIKEAFTLTFEKIEELINGVIDTVGWLAEKIEEHWAIVQPIIIAYAALIATRLIVQWILAGVQATISAAKQVRAWLATKVAALSAVATHIATAITMVARWVFMGAQAMAQAARMAAAWLIAMGPVGWVIATIIGLVVIIIANWDKIVAATRFLGDKLKEIWKTTVEWIKGKVSDLVTFFGGLKGKFSSAASGMFDGLKDAFKGAVNWIIRKWNNLQLKIGGSSIKIPFGPELNIPSVSLSTPNIPMLAKGGNIRDNNSVIVGDAGPEILSGVKGARVTPLDRAGELGNGSIDRLLIELIQAVREGKNIIMNDREVGKILEKTITEQQNRKKGRRDSFA